MVASLRGDALAALAYGTNWYLIFRQESYFDTLGRPSLFQHLWSLAIEQQFYLLWPPLLALLLRRYRRPGALMVALAGAAGSAALMAWLYLPESDPSRIYYGTDTRALAPLLGAALACIAPRIHAPPRAGCTAFLAVDAVAFTALGGTLAAWMLLGEYQPWLYRGGFVAVALLATVLIAALTHPSATFSSYLLSRRALRWLGTRSYAVYLWHWPVFMITRPGVDLALPGWLVLALRVGATLLLAELSFRCIEDPIRAGALGRAWRRVAEARGLRRWQVGAQLAVAALLVVGGAARLGVAVEVRSQESGARSQEQDGGGMGNIRGLLAQSF